MRFSVNAVFGVVNRFSAPLNRFGSDVNKVASAMERRMKSINNVNSRIYGGFKLAAVGAAAMSVPLVKIAALGMNFEQTMVNAAAKFPEGIKAGSAAFAELEATAKRVGANTEFTASEAAEGLNFLAMAGFNAQQSIAALPGLVDLATASQTDLALASDIATDTLGAFGLATRDAAQLGLNLSRVNDVLAKTANSTNTSISQLFEAIIEGGPVAKSSGASIETYAAMAGKLANAGIKASVAGTTLKNVFIRLAAPTPESARALKKLGVETADQAGNLRDVIDVMGDLQMSLKGFGTAERANFLNEIFGKIPIAGVNVLLEEGADSIRKFRTEIEGAGGTTASVAAQMRATSLGNWKTFMSTLEDVGLTIFDSIKLPLNESIVALTEFFRANKGAISADFRDGVAWLRSNLPEIVSYAKFAGKALLAWGAFAVTAKVVTTAVGGVSLAVSGVNVALAAMAAFKAGGLVAAIGSVATALLGVKAAAAGAAAGIGAAGLSGGAAGAAAGAAGAAGAAAVAGGVAIGTAAVAGTGLALWANENLKETTGGLGIFDLIAETESRVRRGDIKFNPRENMGDRMAQTVEQMKLERSKFDFGTREIERDAAAQREADVAGRYTPTIAPYTPQGMPQAEAQARLIERNTTETQRSDVRLHLPKGVTASSKRKIPGVTVVPTGKF